MNEKARPATSRPSENATARKSLRNQRNAELAPVLPMHPPWSQALIEGADGPIPSYGSAAWAALPDDSRTKVAATVLAAETWRTRHTRPDFFEPAGSRRAREIAEARRPRPGDYQGGPVSWEPEAPSA